MIQKSLIKNKVLDEAKSIKFLESKGYTVLKEEDLDKNTIPNIILYFYKNLNDIYSKFGYEGSVVINEKPDRNAIQKYIIKNKKLGVTKQQSIENLKGVIDLFFKYYKELKLTAPPANLRFLLTDGAWILNKLKAIHKNAIEKYRESPEMETWRNRLYESEDDTIRKLRETRHKELLNYGEEDGKN